MSKASAYFSVRGIDGKHDVKELKRDLGMLRGVMSVSVHNTRVAVDYDTTGAGQERIQRTIEKLGYEVSDVHIENHMM